MQAAQMLGQVQGSLSSSEPGMYYFVGVTQRLVDFFFFFLGGAWWGRMLQRFNVDAAVNIDTLVVYDDKPTHRHSLSM